MRAGWAPAACAVAAVMLTGCTATVAGVARRAPETADSNGVNLELLQTGSYKTVAGPALGTAGPTGGGQFEGIRMAANVVGPWQVDASLRQQNEPDIWVTMALQDPQTVEYAMNPFAGDPDGRIAGSLAAHGYLAGFSTARGWVATGAGGPDLALNSMVLRFPDPDSATAAANEMAGIISSVVTGPSRPVAVEHHPDAIARSATYNDDGATAVESFTPHGPYVFYQEAAAGNRGDRDAAARALLLVDKTLDRQGPLIDQFVPTDPAKLADLPKDPTGLIARTLTGDQALPGKAMGVWRPDTWLHFVDDPVQTAPMLAAAGVEWVAQRLTTLYQVRDAAGATRLADQLGAEAGTSPNVVPASGVPGLPAANCFNRTKGFATGESGASVQRVAWHYHCVARVDRFAFTSFSNQEVDAKQQLSAQYLILAGGH